MAPWLEGMGTVGGLIAGKDFVCVSVMDWDWPFWTSRQHLMLEFASANRVLFVDPPLTFASDYRGAWHDQRLRQKMASWLRNGGLSRRGPNLLVWSPPPTIPFNRIRNRSAFLQLLGFNQQLFRSAMLRALRRVGIRHPLLWVSFNVYFGDAVVGAIGESLSVYHCTDEISGFPGYSPLISEIERRLMARCDLILASSVVLRDAKAECNPHCYFVPNGADVELFERAAAWDGAEPEDLLRLPSPRAGFIGQVEYRFDCELMKYVSAKMPSWSFVLIGPVQRGNREVEELHGLPNLHFLGLKEREQLPGYLAHLDVALIPYKINHLTRGIYPLKLYEYLAAGKPVIATPIPALCQMDDMVYVAGDGPSFVRAIERAAEDDSAERQMARREMARRHSWRARAEEISAILERACAKKAFAAAGSLSREIANPISRASTGHLLQAARPGGNGEEETASEPSAPMGTTTWRLRRIGFFLRLGKDLSHRHKGVLKRLAYRLLGDPNAHRRIRAAHVLRALEGMGLVKGEVLDAGCGEGACALAVAVGLRRCRVTGVDIDPRSVAACKRMAGKLELDNLRFECADIRELPFSEQFDAAICVDVLEHIDDDERALRSIHSALRRGGRLVVHVPMRHQLQKRFLPTHNGHHVSDHVRDEYLREEIVGKVMRAGFAVDSVCTTFGPAGELAFELNTLFTAIPWVRELLVAVTYPAMLMLACLEITLPDLGCGNSFLVVATKRETRADPGCTQLPEGAGCGVGFQPDRRV